MPLSSVNQWVYAMCYINIMIVRVGRLSTLQGVTAHNGHHTIFAQLTGWSLLYPYTADLLCLDFCSRNDDGVTAHDALAAVSTPLDVRAWGAALSSNPDRVFATYISNGL